MSTSRCLKLTLVRSIALKRVKLRSLTDKREAHMAFDANRSDLTLGVIGTGAMGRGIVQVAAAGGINVLMMDTRAGAAEEAREFVAKMLARAAEKGSMSKEDAAAATARIKVINALAEFKPC